MKKNKYLTLVIAFVLSLFMLENVHANTTGTYGYLTCDGDKRWTPENTCEDADDRQEHNNAFTFTLNDDGSPAGVGTDLFNLSTYGATYVESNYPDTYYTTVWAVDAAVAEYNDKCGSWDKYWQHFSECPSLAKEVITNLFKGKTNYYHDYSKVSEYYRVNGKLPDVIVAQKMGYDITIGNFWGYEEYWYAYFPSDWLTMDEAIVNLNLFSPTAAYADLIDPRSWEIAGFSNGMSIVTAVFGSTSPDMLSSVAMQGTNALSQREVYYFANNLSDPSIINSCDEIDTWIIKLSQVKSEQGASSEEAVKLEADIRNACKDYLGKKTKTNKSKCYEKCLKIDKLINDLTNYKATNECGLGQDMTGWLIRILKIFRYIAPIIVIILSIVDYIGAISAAEDDAMKKAGARLGKRILILIIFFLLPSLIQFILNTFNVPGFDSSNPYCLK